MRTVASIRFGVALGLAAVVMSGCFIGGDPFQAKFSRSEELTAPLTDITALDVATNIGAIRLEAAAVTEVRIRAEIKVKDRTEERARELAEQVRIAAKPSGDTLYVKALKPAGLRDNNLSVDYTITAPAELALESETDVGEIRTSGFLGPVKAATDVGAIHCTGLRSAIDLRSNVGDLSAEYVPEAPAAVNATMETDVGDIEFTGPQEISARIAATTNVGDIHTARPITVTGSVRKSLRGSLGQGEGRINLNTDVGAIRIR